MNKQPNKISTWYKLAETNKSLIFYHVFLATLRVVGLILSPIFAAKVTVCITRGDFEGAIINLSIEIGIIILRIIAWDQVYRNAARIFTNTYKKVQNKIYRKAYRAKTSNFKITSKEKLLNIIGTDVEVVSNFADTLGVKISRIIQVVLTLIIMFSSHWLVGTLVLLLSVVNFAILLYLNKKIAKYKLKTYENKDKIYENFSEVLSNQDLIKEYDMGPTIAEKYFQKCDDYTKVVTKHKILTSTKDNFFVMFYKIVIFVITVLMVIFVKENLIELTVYFVLVSYLLTATELINDIINITANIEETDVSTKRINTVLNFTDEEFIAYGNIKDINVTNNLNIIDVSYSNSEADSQFTGKISNINMSFSSNSINLIKGNKDCGKRIIFYLLSRRIKPTSGNILLNNINIFDYEKLAYKRKIFNAFNKPKFLDDSIMTNFQVVEKNKDVIINACKHVDIYDYICSLPEGFDTNITSANLPTDKIFLIGMVMSILRNSPFLVIYEIPQAINKEDKLKIKEVIKNISKTKTVILFTSCDTFDDVSKQIYTIKLGKIADHIIKHNSKF